MIGDAAWSAALALIGTRFRLHGRDPASGLDCVGLVAAAYARAGRLVGNLPQRYRLSGPGQAVAEAWLQECGAGRVTDAQVGDIGLFDMDSSDGRGAGGPGQLHLALLGLDAAVHAHAGLRRVVLSPLPLPGRQLSRWRIMDQE